MFSGTALRYEMLRERVTPPMKLVVDVSAGGNDWRGTRGSWRRRGRRKETYSQYPGLARGPNAVVVAISNITPAAPPCMTPFKFVYFASMYREYVTVPCGVASKIFNSDMSALSKPRNLFAFEMRK